MKNEQWINKVKERLEGYSEPLPASGWERLERELKNTVPVSDVAKAAAPRRKTVFMRHWAAAAAAALLLAVSSFTLWLYMGRIGDETLRMHVPAIASLPNGEPVQPEADRQPDAVRPVQPLLRAMSSGERLAVAGEAAAEQTYPLPAEEAGSTEDKQPEAGNGQAKEGDVLTEAKEESHQAEPRQTHPSARKTASHQAMQRTRKRQGWSVGLSVGNTGNLGNAPGNGSSSSGLVMSDASSFLANGNMGGVQLIDANISYLTSMYGLERLRSVHSMRHKQPLSFGISVRKNLPHGFSLESGLTYTYLASEILLGTNEEVDQRLHYLGIPLRANWNIVDRHPFVLYLSAGGAVEKCVYGKIDQQRATVDPLQFSVMGAVGAQYNISKRVGIYIEPGVSYYFDDGADTQTIRKERPCNFTLQGGVRLTY